MARREFIELNTGLHTYDCLRNIVLCKNVVCQHVYS